MIIKKRKVYEKYTVYKLLLGHQSIGLFTCSYFLIGKVKMRSKSGTRNPSRCPMTHLYQGKDEHTLKTVERRKKKDLCPRQKRQYVKKERKKNKQIAKRNKILCQKKKKKKVNK